MNTPDPLDELLSQWQVRAEPPALLPRDVWARISADEAELSWWEVLASQILRPRALAITALVAILVGTVLALIDGNGPQLDPHTAYVQSISPFASLHLAAP
jgi:hypothetical protein